VALLFYSTNYTPEKAQAEINRLLMSIGARRISFEYDTTRTVSGMTFTLDTPRGEQEYLLPVRRDRVSEVLRRQGVLRGMGSSGHRPDPALQHKHAASVAWRTLLEWLKVQAAIIETDQGAPDEIMLPYMLVPGSDGAGGRYTVYQQYSGDLALPSGSRS